MAEKRMFSKTIIDSDAFLDMPLSTQSLYFHLSMRADDDGFLNNVKKIQRMIGASGDDLKILFAKKFLLAFPDGVCVVKHWRMHNYIAKDRYKPTNYERHKMDLIVNENGSYSQKSKENQHVIQDNDGLYTDCIQDDDGLMTQNRLDKNRLDKNSSAAEPRFESAKPTKIDINFSCNQKHKDLAQELNLAIDLERDKFVDYYLNKTNKKFLDWDAAFRNWLRKAAEFAKTAKTSNRACPPTEQESAQADEYRRQFIEIGEKGWLL